MEAVAKLRNCPMSPRKMRLVVDLIRGKKVNQALHILKFTKRKLLNGLKNYFFPRLIIGNKNMEKVLLMTMSYSSKRLLWMVELF